MSRDRLLVIDADLPKRLATTLVSRQRAALSAAELGLAELKDPQLLRELAGIYNGVRAWVLVTGDDAMPAEHGQIIHETRATIATIHPEYSSGMTEHAWRTDVTHRWAHRMQDQTPETVRRYSLDGSQVWRPRRRHRRQITQHGWSPWRPASPRPDASGLQEDPPATPAPDRLPGFD